MKTNDRFAEIMRNRRNIFVTTAWGDTVLVAYTRLWFTVFSGHWNASGFIATSQINVMHGRRSLFDGHGWHIRELHALLFLSYHIAYHRSSFASLRSSALQNCIRDALNIYKPSLSPFVSAYPSDILRLEEYFGKLTTVNVKNVGGQFPDLFGGSHV